MFWRAANFKFSQQHKFYLKAIPVSFVVVRFTRFHRKAFSNNSFFQHFTFSFCLLSFLRGRLPVQSVRVPSSSCSSSTHFCGRAGDFWPEMQRKLSLNVTTSFRAQQQIDCNKIEPKVTIRGGCFRDKINTQDSIRPDGHETGIWWERKELVFKFKQTRH